MTRTHVVVKVIAALVVIAAFAALLHTFPIGAGLAHFQQWVRGAGVTGYVVYALVYAICAVMLVPGSILTIGAGAIFGVVGGTIVVMIGATCGATLAFLLAKTVLRERVERAVSKNAKFRAVDKAIGNEGAKIVFLIRLSVVFPFTWVNYALGLTAVRTIPYVVATFIGMAPAVVAFVYIGAVAGEAATAASHVRIAIYVVGAVAALVVSFVIGRIAVVQIRRAGIES